MNVLHINNNYIRSELHQNLISELDSLGIVNQAFVPVYDETESVVSNVGQNIEICKCFKKRDRFLFDYKQMKILHAIKESIDINGFDLIHAYTLFTDGNCAHKLSKEYGIPFVVAVRNTDINVFFKWMIHLRARGISILKDASVVFCLSPAYADQLLSFVPSGLKEDIQKKIRVIPNGIDSFWFCGNDMKTHIRDKERLRLIYAGVIDKNKNITAIQSAVDLLIERGYKAKLTVVGKVKDSTVFGRIQDDANTEYHEPIDKFGLKTLFQSNDFFVMPSIHESFGLVYAEAISQGLPIIYTKNQGFDRQFPDGEVGFAVNPYSPSDIAEKVLSIDNSYSDFSKRAKIGSKKFDWKRIGFAYKTFYERVLENNGSL